MLLHATKEGLPGVQLAGAAQVFGPPSVGPEQTLPFAQSPSNRQAPTIGTVPPQLQALTKRVRRPTAATWNERWIIAGDYR